MIIKLKYIIPSFIIALLSLSIAAATNGDKALARSTAEAPDFETIKKDISDPSSQYHYPKLFKQFMSNDTSMTLEQYRHLYYGFIFQKDYDPYRISAHAERVEKLYFKQKHSREECDTIMKYAELSLTDNPFDLRQMTFLIIALKEKQKHARASIWQFKLNHLVGAIMSSGYGTKEMPWYVISPVHEYNLLNFMNYIVTGHQDEDNGTIDYLTVKSTAEKDSGKSTPEGFYFNITELARTFEKRHTK
ncbi:MAG: DUF4919 domain-containing protein [Muribaculaceae bacterium]|nr:DUF4919 domain-containing protein [Muribaculaceae bacterium]